MAQHDMDVSNQTFTATRADINAALQALASNNSGATEPATTYAYQWWADTTSGILKQRNAANSAWVNVLNLATGVPTGAAASGANSDITALLNSSGIRFATRADVASAGTVVLTSAPDDIQITGTTAITGFTVPVGRVLRVRFAAASLTLTNNANIVTQTGANIVTQAGDTCILRATAANTVEVLNYTRNLPPSWATALATTSGSTAQFTGIPATAQRITALFAGVSTAGATNVSVQVGSGSFATSGYSGAQSQLNGATGSSSNTSSMVPLDNAAGAVNVRSGRITFHHMGGNLWVWDGVVACAGSSIVEMTAGSIQLAGALDRLQLLMNGADTFDAGSVRILVE